MVRKQPRRPEPIERRPVLDAAKKDEMLAILIRNPKAFAAVYETLAVKHVRDISEGHGLVWRTVLAFYEHYQTLPAEGILNSDLHNALGQNATILTAEELTQLDEFVAYAFDDAEHGADIETSESHCRVAIDTAKQFLEECKIGDLNLAIVRDGQIALDIPDLILKHQREFSLIQSLTGRESEVLCPEGWEDKPRLTLSSTGIPVVNELTGGGWAGGEVFLFLASTGVGKTTIAVQSLAALAAQAKADCLLGRTREGKRPVVVLITLEETQPEFRLRLLSSAARIPWSRLRSTPIAELCSRRTKGAVEETKYERDEFRNMPAPAFRSEKQRLAQAVQIVNEHLVVIGGSDKYEGLGGGGVPQLANEIASYFRQHSDRYPIAIWVDHVSALYDEMAGADPELQRSQPQTLKRIPRQFRDSIARKWNVPIGLLHQTSGETTGRGPRARITHADAEGSKTIAQYATFAITLSNPTHDNLCRVATTKHRREEGRERVAHIDGDFQRLVDRDKTHTIEFGEIMDRESMSDAAANRNVCAPKIYTQIN